MIRKIVGMIGLPFTKTAERGFALTCSEGQYFKGLLFERTGRRENVYLWSVTRPRFHPAKGLALNFSSRLNDGFTLNGSEQDVIQRAVECIRAIAGLREALTVPLSPITFIRNNPVPFNYPQYAPVNVVFDLGVSAALAGEEEAAYRLLLVLIDRLEDFPSHLARE